MTLKEINQSRKKIGEELQQYLHFRRRKSVVPPKKGKGSYNRKKVNNEKTGCTDVGSTGSTN